MGIGNRIKEARQHSGYTQGELADLVGVTKAAIANYENDISHPKEAVLYKLINVLKVDANYLFQDNIHFSSDQRSVSFKEYELIEKYRKLDKDGKHLIESTLTIEYQRTEELRNHRLQLYMHYYQEFQKLQRKTADAEQNAIIDNLINSLKTDVKELSCTMSIQSDTDT